MNTRQDALTQGIVSEFTQDTTNKPAVWYRYYETHYARGYFDDNGDWYSNFGPSTVVNLMEIPVIKLTPCGAWVGYDEHDKKFVNLSWNKRYALPTIELARASYKARKKREIQLMEARAANAKAALAAAESQWADK